MPRLLLLTDAHEAIQGVVGCRVASEEGLFLERYFDSPIENVLTAALGVKPRRADIVEVGNFACRNPRAATAFVSLLPQHLLSRDLTWVTFTATASIRRILKNLGARCADLGHADGACSQGSADDWGRYYDSQPRVMAGYLPLARRIPALWNAPHAD